MEISEQNTKDGAIPAGQTPDTDISLEGSSGISKEDQAEIAARIDSIAQANRISVTPEVLVVRASKPGFIFPLFVNAGAVVLLISGFLILSAFHSRDDSEIRRESSTATRSAEGRLIQEIRKETAAELQAKDQEIAYITARLSGVGEELGRLSTEMEDRIREREDDLRRQMDQQIEAERRRLLSLNLSEEVIAERMRAFEAEQIVLFNENLAGYRRQLEEDRVAAEINLNKLREEYERNLETLNAERAQALETARLREANARNEETDNSAEIDALYEQDRENLMSAREELQRLTGEQERSQAIEWQISGYYNTAVNQIRNQQLEAAADTLTALRLFMDTPEIQNSRIMRTRKEINMAAAEALSVMLEETIRRRRENSAISQIVQSGFDTEEVRRLADEAASAYAAGDIAAFEALYREALNRIPGIDRLQGYFTGPGGGEAVSNAILQGEAFYQEGNYRGALDSYTAALVYDARYREQEPRIREHLQRSGYEVASREERRRETQGAAPLMNRGDNFYSAGRYQDAAASYMSVLEQYPYCDQVPAAIAGLKRSMDAQTQAVMVPAAADTTELAALRSQNEALSRTVDELRRNHAAELQRRETQIRAEYGERTSSTVTVVDDRYNQLMSLYRDYTRRDDAAITQAAGHVSGIVQAKNILDEFLVSEAVTAVFPGLSDRIKRYDRAFTAAGHDDALMRAADFALRLSTQRSGAEMERYLAAEIGRNSGDPWMRDYLETLRGFIR